MLVSIMEVWSCCGILWKPKLSALASTMSEETEMLGMTQRTASPTSSTEVETLCLGAVFC